MYSKCERTKQKPNRINVITLMCLARILIPIHFIFLRHWVFFSFWFVRSFFFFQFLSFSVSIPMESCFSTSITIGFGYQIYDFQWEIDYIINHHRSASIFFLKLFIHFPRNKEPRCSAWFIQKINTNWFFFRFTIINNCIYRLHPVPVLLQIIVSHI